MDCDSSGDTFSMLLPMAPALLEGPILSPKMWGQEHVRLNGVYNALSVEKWVKFWEPECRYLKLHWDIFYKQKYDL